MVTDSVLKDLLRFFRREGPFALMGGALRTYPDGDWNDVRLYQCCCELEGLGLIRRVWQENRVCGPVVLFQVRQGVDAKCS